MKHLALLFFGIIINAALADNSMNTNKAEELYIKLYRQRRLEHLEAIKRLQKLSSYEQQYNMMMMIVEKVFTVIQASRAKIEASGYIPAVSDFPEDETTKDALSNILENTALISEVILRLPDISQDILKINNNWNVLLQWSIAFTRQVQYLLDKTTIKMLHLVSQELNHTERDENYVNPYRKSYRAMVEEEDLQEIEKKKKKKSIKKGPRLHVEL